MIDKELTQLGWDFATIRTADPFDRRTYGNAHALPPFVELLIIDEADWRSAVSEHRSRWPLVTAFLPTPLARRYRQARPAGGLASGEGFRQAG
jgi:hypothetical protein